MESVENPVFLLTEQVENEYGSRPRKSARPSAGKRKRFTAPTSTSPLLDALKRWRLAESKKLQLPAFRILSDKALSEIADDQPGTAEDLTAVKGVSARIVKQWGGQILGLVRQHS